MESDDLNSKETSTQSDVDPPYFTPDQVRKLLVQIELAWKNQNYQLFKKRLTLPQFQIDTHPSHYGSWSPGRRILTLSQSLLKNYTWLEVIEVLRHEMAHQYVDEVLRVKDESAHGETFKKVCRERGIDFRAHGHPELSESSQKVLTKINKLLALAQSDNQYEAETAANQAQALLIKHHFTVYQQIDLNYEDSTPLDQLSAQDFIDSLRAQHQNHLYFRQLGSPKKRHYEYEYMLSLIHI